jgi:hypothetical protein
MLRAILMDMTHRVNVNFSDEAYEALESLANREGKTISGILRDAIALKLWFANTHKDGGRVLVEREGQIREVMSV